MSLSILDGMMKLRYLRASALYLAIDCKTSRYYNLEYISKVVILGEKFGQLLKVFPHIRKLGISIMIGGIFNFSSLIQLESLKLQGLVTTIGEITFPSSIIKLKLDGLRLSSEQMSIVGALPKLEVLKLFDVRFDGEKWETRDDEFQKLKYLKLELITDPFEWNMSSWEHFPVLRQLIIEDCLLLKEIPREILYIPTLQLISVIGMCTLELKKFVNILKEQSQDEGYEDFTVTESETGIEGRRPWSWR